MSDSKEKLGLFSLIGIIMSAIIGAGIFNLMKEMARSASVVGVLIGWLITGIGMGALVLCMVYLTKKRPDLDAGVFSYAQAGFGDYVGFNAIFGYWVSVIIGNVALGTLLFSALSYFLPFFGDGQNIASIIGASVLLWTIHGLILRGLDQAALLNFVVMLAKLMPIIIFLFCVILGFQVKLFTTQFWANTAFDFSWSELFEQVKGTVLGTVWVFIGIEGALVFSGRARKKSDVGKATLIGFAAVLLIYVLITILSFGILPQEELAQLKNPAMAYILEQVIGKPGAIIVNVGVILSTFGAWLANTLLAEEVAFQAGKTQLFPRSFKKENSKGVANYSLIVTNLLVQVLFLTFLFTDQAYSVLSQLSSATILLPYTCVALFEVKTVRTEQSPQPWWTKGIGYIATLYMVWLIYTSGTLYIVLTILTLLPGTVLYIYVKKIYQKPVFVGYEWTALALVSALSCYGLLRFSALIH